MITHDDVARFRKHRELGVAILVRLKGACTPKPEGKPKGLEPAGSTAPAPSNVPVADTIAESEAWGRELPRMMEPLGDADAAAFEPLSPMRAEEWESVAGLVPLITNHGDALKEHAVRLYRLQEVLVRMRPDKIEPAPARRGRGRPPSEIPSKVKAEGWAKEINARKKGIDKREIAKQIAGRAGEGTDYLTVEREARRVSNAKKAKAG